MTCPKGLLIFCNALSYLGRVQYALFGGQVPLIPSVADDWKDIVVGGGDGDEQPYWTIDLTHSFNGYSVGPKVNFDLPYNESWAPEFMPRGRLPYQGIEFDLPQKWDGVDPDNLVSDGQEIPIPEQIPYPRAMVLLYAGDFNDHETNQNFVFNFEDGTNQTVEASIHNWWNLHWINTGPVTIAPYHYKSDGTKNYNQTQMLAFTSSIQTLSPLKSITLPTLDTNNRLHIYAMTLIPSTSSLPKKHGLPLTIQSSEFTSKYEIIDGQVAFGIELTIANPIPLAKANAEDTALWIDEELTIRPADPSLKTLRSAEVARIMPGEQVIAICWVVPREGNRIAIRDQSVKTVRQKIANGLTGGGGGGGNGAGPRASFQVVRKKSGVVALEQDVDVVLRGFGGGDAKGEDESLLRDLPEWFDQAKFGIFMHWGVFAVPGWAPPGVYAEWYWWHQQNYDTDPGSFWSYHLKTYGAEFVYDDFIPSLGGNFSADAITDIVASSGAKYFVPTSMHHDGFAIFDTGNATHRSAVYYGPKRDFLDELFQSAKARHPDIVRGSYFSMPEWYNPDSGAGGYGFDTWPGILAHNAYNTSQIEPYTGRLPGRNFLRDEQLVKMKILAEKYDTRVMWCDIGGPNLTHQFLEEWHPYADKNGLQVVMNNRCGAYPQFDTPEYSTFSSIQYSKWESSESVDPASYGYNRETKPEDYRSPQYLITSLVDIVSKNGNYLLNIGPDGNGTVPPPVAERLSAIGDWLGHSGDCIYNTTYFFLGAQDSPDGTLRFTRTKDTFCFIAIAKPSGGSVSIKTPVPILANDTISLLGAGDGGYNLTWSYADDDGIKVEVADDLLDKIENSWAFQVKFSLGG